MSSASARPRAARSPVPPRRGKPAGLPRSAVRPAHSPQSRPHHQHVEARAASHGRQNSRTASLNRSGRLEVCSLPTPGDHVERVWGSPARTGARRRGQRASSSPQISRSARRCAAARSRWSPRPSETSCVRRVSDARRPRSIQQTRRISRGVPANSPRQGGIELLGGRREHLPRARDPGPHLLLGQRPLPARVVSARIRLATRPGWRR